VGSRGGHEVVIKLLLATCEVDVNSKDNNSKTPLLRAAARDYLAVVERLFEEKADVNAGAGSNRGTALEAAAERGYSSL
jgi:ankyrin repeat protein